MQLRLVHGTSMAPTFLPGEVIVVARQAAKVGSVVVAMLGGREVVKRVEKISNGRYYLIGDNRLESTDSRELGPVKKPDIKGVVIFSLPSATKVKRSAHFTIVARSLAAVLLVMALTQLVRFDKFTGVMDGYGGMGMYIAAALVVAEVFALPYLLNMALSPLGRVCSLAAGWVTALFWSFLAVFPTTSASTGHLGSFVALPPGKWQLLFGASLMIAMGIVTWLGRRKATGR